MCTTEFMSSSSKAVPRELTNLRCRIFAMYLDDIDLKSIAHCLNEAGATDDVKVCVFKSGDGDNYEVDIKELQVCHDKTEANQEHGGHTICRCKEGEKGCKKSKADPDKAGSTSAPKPDPTNYCLAKYKVNDPKRKPVSVADAKKVSDERKAIIAAEAKDHADGHGILWTYNRQKDIAGANNGRFPTFDPATDFYPGRPNDVNIGTLCGTREQDFAAANAIAGLKCTPTGYTWHHHEDLGRMQLVKTSAHADEDHSGGVSIWKAAFCDKDPSAPKTDPALCSYPRKESLSPKCSNP
jgi:hypothetical protein